MSEVSRADLIRMMVGRELSAVFPKIEVPRGDVVLEVGEGILSQDFEPTPSPTTCAICDYRIVCPVAAL